jgi:hypothetical protein
VGPRRPVPSVLALAGAALLIASAFLDWLEGGPKGTGVPIQFLWSPAQRPPPGFFGSLGFLCIVLGLVALFGVILRTGMVTALAGALGIAMFVLSLITLYRVQTGPYGLGIGDVFIGAWMLLIGGVLALIGGFLEARPAPVVTRGARVT